MLILLFVGACGGQTADTFPTVAPTAAQTAVPSPNATPIVANNVPPTWTPSTTDQLPTLNAGRESNPNATPTLVGAIPTFTIVPPTPTATLTPSLTPTATRYVSFVPNLPPSDELGPSKVGLHVNRNNSPEIMEFVRRAQPAVMKGVADLGYMAEVKIESPRTTTVGRIPVENQDYGGNPEEKARELVAEQLREYELNPAIDYWEGWNEPDPGLERMDWYARFEAERVREMARHGFKTAVGGFSTGVPELDEFELFVPAIEAAIEHAGILTLHEYSAPSIEYGFGSPLPDQTPQPDRGALIFRYRWYYEEILIPRGLYVPLVISEAGIDGLVGPRPGPNGQGWKDFRSYWTDQGVWGSTGREAYINQMAWYDNGIRRDGYVIGIALFTAGGGSRWESYDLNNILPELADYVIGQGP
ncbi:MAG: hypothetical protein AAF614_22560 [Chloroflexota bacterium]